MYIALRSFVGTVSAGKNQVLNIKDKAVAEDLKKCGYIKDYEVEKTKEVETTKEEVEVTEEKKSTKKKK